MSRLHVLLVPSSYPAPETPVRGLFMRDLAHAISLQNRVTVLAPPSATSPSDSLVDGIRTIRMREPSRQGRVATTQRLFSLNATVSRLRREGTPVDILHAHHFGTGVLAVLVGRMRSLPVVITENLSSTLAGNLTPYERRLARFTYRGAACVCPVSPLSEEQVRGLEPKGRYEVVPDVVDIDAFAATERRPTAGPVRQLLAVSNLVPRKGLADLIDAVRLLMSDGREVALTVVGEGPQRAALEARADGLPVALVGARSRGEIVELLRDADVFAMPTLGDPFGIAAVEAFAARVPVVVTSAAGSAALLGPLGATVVAPGDPAALHDALAEALVARASVRIGAIDELREYCGVAAVGARLDCLYREVSARRRARGVHQGARWTER